MQFKVALISSLGFICCMMAASSAVSWNGEIYVSTAGGYVNHSKDDGLNWYTDTFSNFPTPIPSCAYSVYAVDNHVYIGSNVYLAVSHNHLFTVKAGFFWPPPVTVGINSVYAKNSRVWAVGDVSTTYDPLLAISLDHGNTWPVQINLPPPLTNTCTAVYAIENRTFIGTDGNGLGITDDFGQTWIIVDRDHGLGGDRITFISGYNNTVFVGLYKEGGYLSISEDAGETWKVLSLTPRGTVSSIFVDDLIWWDTFRVYVSIEGGGLAISDAGNLGKNWTIITATDGLGTNNVTAVAAMGETIYAAVSYNATATGNYLMISRDKGQTWQSRSIGSKGLSIFAQKSMN